MKRIFDLAVAVVALPIVVPVTLACMLAIKLTSPGPAIFQQTRVGRHETPFTCYKLRTMHVGTASAPTHQTAASAVTPLGGLLRRLKLDELPQLWNIFKGDMSFVGPRPCLPTQDALVRARRALGLYAIRPGITGVAQVQGIDMSDPARLATVDAGYLADMSIGADLRLMVATVLGAGSGDRIKR